MAQPYIPVALLCEYNIFCPSTFIIRQFLSLQRRYCVHKVYLCPPTEVATLSTALVFQLLLPFTFSNVLRCASRLPMSSTALVFTLQ